MLLEVDALWDEDELELLLFWLLAQPTIVIVPKVSNANGNIFFIASNPF
ncbi:hypothetical protein WDC_1079 [Paucilactobacillus wasatchensis]|uniref:Uncharacterized protein n=1 Tax=Paucilactobacillus wasatchensis TaxID=1335616 RepID=A0A0D1A6J5_9LACO|nr:hypothetical protein WDC_1079 [Paucilactobacillus wasatchensis]